MIDLEFLTTQTDIIQIAKRYWAMNSDGTFKEDMKALLPCGAIYNSFLLESIILRNSTARDLRRRCPICGMPPTLRFRRDALAPIAPRLPCDDCRYMKRQPGDFTTVAGLSMSGERSSTGQLTLPISALVVLDALAPLLGPKLYTGFAVYDCDDLAPAHISRFIRKLVKAGALGMITDSASQINKYVTNTQYLADEAILEHDLRIFKHQLTTGKVTDKQGIWKAWLESAIAEFMQFICDRSAVYGLSSDPENEELCSVLEAAVATYSIAEVRTMSLLAVMEAVALVEQGMTVNDAVICIPNNIEKYCHKAAEGSYELAQLERPSEQECGALAAWFHKQYHIDENTRGSAVSSLIG